VLGLLKIENIYMPGAKRKIADFFILGCGLRRLYNSRAQALARELMDEFDFQHLRDTHPCKESATREAMYDQISTVLIKGNPVDYLEFGVFRGDSIRYWTTINRSAESRFFGFDSFEGLPEVWGKTRKKGDFNLEGNMPVINDERVRFVKGWFDKTVESFAAKFEPRNRLVLHLDADLYSSTMLALVFFNKWMGAGTILIFDEFSDRQHEFKAFRDFLQIWKREYRVIGQMDNYAKISLELLS
jgi:O-methyltransferase